MNSHNVFEVKKLLMTLFLNRQEVYFVAELPVLLTWGEECHISVNRKIYICVNVFYFLDEL